MGRRSAPASSRRAISSPFLAFTTLAGRVGAARGSVTIHFVPVVAIVLGVVVRGEAVLAVSLLGAALVMLGAYLTGRRGRPAARPN